MKNFQLPATEIIKIKNSLEKQDGIIAFPTDTVWGIGCLIQNEHAVRRIYLLKNRPQNKPLILLGSKIDYLVPYVKEIPEKAWAIIDEFLPGAVTLVLEKSDKTPDYITSGFHTVGIRIPDYQPFVELLKKCTEEHVLATTSANISGKGSNSQKEEVKRDLGDAVDYILDDYGYPPKGKESTVIEINNQGEINILRQGSISLKS